MRAFHCGIERLLGDSASDSEVDASAASPSSRRLREFRCNPLGMPLDLYQHLKDTKDTFHCPNCLAGVHQCFKCKQEGVVEAHATDPNNARFANEPVFRYIYFNLHDVSAFVSGHEAAAAEQNLVCDMSFQYCLWNGSGVSHGMQHTHAASHAHRWPGQHCIVIAAAFMILRHLALLQVWSCIMWQILPCSMCGKG